MIGGEKGEEKKMKSTELRLGNYVTGFQNTIRKVSGILDDGHVYTSDIVNGEFTIESDNDLQGISLSPDILLKTGFEKISTFTITKAMTYDLGRDRYLSIGSIGSPNEMIWLCSNGSGGITSDLIYLHNFDYDGKLYLHKLQNIVHSLTGAELKSKLT